MCGRMVVSEPDLSELAAPFHVARVDSSVWTPRYNLAPTQLAPIVTNEPERRLALARFGLVPGWAPSERTGNKLINARVETVATRGAFRRSFELRRCIVPVNGYYEWHAAQGGKRPLFIYDERGKPLPLAGIWARWHAPDGQVIESFAVITRPSQGLLRDVHDRMPLEVPWPEVERWLDPHKQDAQALAPILQSEPDLAHLRMREVSLLVNSPQNDGPECLLAPEGSEARSDPQLELFAAVNGPRHERR